MSSCLSFSNAFTSTLNTILTKLCLIIGLVKGLNEVCKALDRKECQLCILANNCDDAKYKKTVSVSFHSARLTTIIFRLSLSTPDAPLSRLRIKISSENGSDIANTRRPVRSERWELHPPSPSASTVRRPLPSNSSKSTSRITPVPPNEQHSVQSEEVSTHGRTHNTGEHSTRNNKSKHQSNT